MSAKELPSPELLRKLLRYESDTGKLYWRERTPDMFTDGKYSAERTCAWWNARYAHKEAFTTIKSDGYRLGDIFSRLYRAHRVIWAIVHGEWPIEQIDHINGIRDDNRIENLRSVSHAENGRNQKLQPTNTSGVCGVGWAKREKKWRARINSNGKQINLGLFDNFDEAVSARKNAEIEFGYHENHGRS